MCQQHTEMVIRDDSAVSNLIRHLEKIRLDHADAKVLSIATSTVMEMVDGKEKLVTEYTITITETIACLPPEPRKCTDFPLIGCGRNIPDDEFRKWDALSQREYGMSGTCIHCQNQLFKPIGTINGMEV